MNDSVKILCPFAHVAESHADFSAVEPDMRSPWADSVRRWIANHNHLLWSASSIVSQSRAGEMLETDLAWLPARLDVRHYN